MVQYKIGDTVTIMLRNNQLQRLGVYVGDTMKIWGIDGKYPFQNLYLSRDGVADEQRSVIITLPKDAKCVTTPINILNILNKKIEDN